MYFRNSQNLPSTPETAEVETPETAPEASAGMVSPHGIRMPAMPTALTMSAAFLSGTRTLMPLSPSSVSAFGLEMQVLRRPGHRVEHLLVILLGNLLVFGPKRLVQDLELVRVRHEERDAFGAEQRLVADLRDVEDVGHRHEPVAHGA